MSRLPDSREMLSATAAAEAFALIMDGKAEADDLKRFLSDMADRPIASGELVAAAQAMRARMRTVAAPTGAIDVCGTGGDGRHSWNVSTAVALVVASCGVPVAKHGNRAASSRSGAADVLAALGISLETPLDTLERQLADLGIAFLFAANHHPAMAHVAAVRKALAKKTIFNMLGPLANPAGVRMQLLGVGDPAWMPLMAEALQQLEMTRALVVHGDDGLDELSISGPSQLWNVRPEAIQRLRLSPQEAGLNIYPLEALRGGGPEENAAALLALLKGQAGAYRDIVCLNAGAALMMANKAQDVRQGAALAARALDEGAALDLLNRWRDFA